jgi:sugar transferase (PEP-CTERM/EpsH1 system associated)
MHLVYSLDPGGLENVVVNLVNMLSRNRFKPYICCFEPGGILKHRVEDDVEIIELKKIHRHEFSLCFRLRALFRAKDIHIVHTHNWGTCCDGIIGAKLARIPIVIHQEHGTFVDTVGAKKRRIIGERIVLRYVDQVITPSEDLKKKMVKILKLPDESIKVILNGVDMKKFSPSLEKRKKKRKELNISDDEMVVGTVGRLEPVKNQKMLLEVIPDIVMRFPNVKVLLVGDGVLKKELIDIAETLRIKDKVMFLGVRADVPEILTAIDVFILPSLTEGISIAILEAMACGLPVIATDVGGNPEIVIHEHTGMLVPLSKPEALSHALKVLLGDVNIRVKYGDNARKMVEEKLSLQKMVREYEEVYEMLIKKKGVEF